MNAMHAFPIDAEGPTAGCSEEPLSARWNALHKAAAALAALVGNSAGAFGRQPFPIHLPRARSRAFDHGIHDLCAVLEQGLFAILQAREQGADGRIAARALLSRFERDRYALLGPEGETDTADDGQP